MPMPAVVAAHRRSTTIARAGTVARKWLRNQASLFCQGNNVTAVALLKHDPARLMELSGP